MCVCVYVRAYVPVGVLPWSDCQDQARLDGSVYCLPDEVFRRSNMGSLAGLEVTQEGRKEERLWGYLVVRGMISKMALLPGPALGSGVGSCQQASETEPRCVS